MVDWLLGLGVTLFQWAFYLFAGVLAFWSLWDAGVKLIGDNHATLRDVAPVLGLAAVGATLLALIGAYGPTLLGGGM